jgi:phosphoglycolate phosphatase
MLGRCAIFDLDGTLIDSQHDIAEAGNHARKSVGLLALPLKDVVTYIGDGVDKLIERLTPDAEPELRQRALAAFKTYYGEHCCHHTQPYPAIVSTLSEMSRGGWNMAVVTNKPSAPTEKILKHLDLSKYFATVRGGDAQRKPEPDQLLSVFHELGCSPRRSWMIGDHHTDIRAGKNAGCLTMFCSWGFGHMDGLNVDVRADSPAQIPRLLF